MKKINSAWTQGLRGEEKAAMESNVIASEIVLDKLSEILYNMQQEKRVTVLSDYDTPSWSHKQAHLNGQLDMLAKVIDIVLVRERDDHPTI